MYQPKVFRSNGGDAQEVDYGGKLVFGVDEAGYVEMAPDASGNVVITEVAGGSTLVKIAPLDHTLINTKSSDKTVRINSRTYAAAASIIGAQVKPRAGINMTNDIIGIESSPGLNSGFSSTAGIVSFKAEPYINAGTTTITGDVRAYEASVGKPSGSGTITGAMSCLKCINNGVATVTGGVYPIHVVTHGDSLAWAGFALLPDDDSIAAVDNSTILADVHLTANAGWIKVQVGTPASHTVKYIPLYDAKAS